MINFNRRNIDTSTVFNEKYQANQRREINDEIATKRTSFNNRMYGNGKMSVLKKNMVNENKVENRVNRLNQKISSNQEINRATNMNNFLGKFK